MKEKFSVFFKPSIGFHFVKSKDLYVYPPGSDLASSESEGSSRAFNFQLTGGIAYFVTDRFALECVPGFLTWTSSTEEDSEDPPNTSVNFGIGLRDLRFGLLYIFGGNQ